MINAAMAMKKTVTTLFLFILFTVCISCTVSPEDRAKKLIREDFKAYAHDYESYKPESFGPLDSLFYQFKNSDDAEYLREEIDNAILQHKEYTRQANEYDEKVKRSFSWYEEVIYIAAREQAAELALEMYERISYYEKKYDSLDKAFKPVFLGWTMDHFFTINDRQGKSVHAKKRFYFDKGVDTLLLGKYMAITKS